MKSLRVYSTTSCIRMGDLSFLFQIHFRIFRKFKFLRPNGAQRGPTYFVICRLYPFSLQPPRQCLTCHLLTNTVSPVRACLSIWSERFRGNQMEDERGPLGIQSSLLQPTENIFCCLNKIDNFSCAGAEQNSTTLLSCRRSPPPAAPRAPLPPP